MAKPLDEDAVRYFAAIIEEMVKRFGYTPEAAQVRFDAMTEHRGDVQGDHVLYHETPAFWAGRFHYGRDDFWRDHPNPDDEHRGTPR